VINRYFTIANLLLITAGVYLAVNGFYAILTARFDYGVSTPVPSSGSVAAPADELKPPLSQYHAIVDRNLFNITAQGTVPEPATVDIENLKETELKLKLWGTVTRQDGKDYAVIEDTKTRQQDLYQLGDSIQNAIVKMILREKVVLNVNDQDEILTMEETAASKTVALGGGGQIPVPKLPVSSYPGKITINRERMEDNLENLNQLMEQATIRPHIEDGRPAGISITGIKPNAIFRRMRLRNGDIITGVNGRPIESVEDAIAIFENISSASDVRLEIKRRGRQQTLDYHIE
jgi:general secretion pathway protein C